MSPREHASVVVLADAARAAEQRPSGTGPQRVPHFNRDLSWLAFDRRVLAEAENPAVPLLERVKFLAIAANNLDEFLMIRVGEVRDLIAANLADEESNGSRTHLDTLRNRSRRVLEQIYACLDGDLVPALRKEGIRIERVADLGKKHRAEVEERFTRDLEPVLTPLAIDPGHLFPFVANLALNLALLLESKKGEIYFVIVKIPESVPRLMPLGKRRFVLLEDVISSHVERFFPGLRLRQAVPFRVIRNSDISIKEEDVQDLLKSVESELRRRERREVVSLEIEGNPDEGIVELLTRSIHCPRADVFLAPGPLKLVDLMQIYDIDEPRLRDAPFNPRIPAQLATAEDIFSIVRRGDVLLHRPYESFATVIEFVQTAAEDPGVVAIKLTLYRTDVGSAILEALAMAATAGKQVTAIVELQARFDERKNITWARRLEEAGVQVVYGLVGIKTHCKVCLVVRREGDALRRYVHLSTGNYNTVTARIYSDIDFFTCDAHFVADAAQLLNLLTGFSVSGVQEILEAADGSFRWKRLIVAPMDYQRWVLDMIEREVSGAKDGKPSKITAKMNALSDPTVIAALYRASRAGVAVRLVVRGICCLVPGVPGTSDNVEVISVVDRFLEHTRVFRFENGGSPEYFISSGDWMPRNFLHRIEVTFPILDKSIQRRLDEQILSISLADNVKGWTLRPDGKYERRKQDCSPVRSQDAFISIARAEAVRLGPYEEMTMKPGSFRRKVKKKKHK
ncbi:MAG TPA: polyphosphate kinase 1 [Thermoanaerobaculia bacterium]|nr:polyphosphate kinase 1 [Thermoanaerobaculia bacterium]